MELLALSRTDNPLTGDGSINGLYRDDKGEHTFVIRNDNQAYDTVLAAVQDRMTGTITDDTLMSTIIHAVNTCNRVEDYLDKFNDINLPIVRKGNHFYVTLAGHDEPIDIILERKLVEAARNGDETTWHSLVRFMQRLYMNTTRYVREQLFSWLQANFNDTRAQSAVTGNNDYHGFTIMPDGRFIGYKGCTRDENGTIVSIYTGTAINDGVEYKNTHIPNTIGSVVSMPRVQVEDNPQVPCSYGLHVGTWDYASHWANGVVLRVAVAPEDVVSIPVDCEGQKLRCCKYEVLETTDVPVNEYVYQYQDDTEEYTNECDYCNCNCDECDCDYCDCDDCMIDKY